MYVCVGLFVSGVWGAGFRSPLSGLSGLVCYAHVFPCIIQPSDLCLVVLLFRQTVATWLELELSISYALAVAGFLFWVWVLFQ